MALALEANYVASYYPVRGPMTVGIRQRVVEYGYEADLDYLTSVDHDDGLSHEVRTWTYDPAGNWSNSGYTYNNLNMMTASPSHSYEHDVLSNRTWRNPFSSTTVECVRDDAGRMTRTYDAPHFPLYDGHGNMVATLARDGQSYDVGNSRQYDVLGGVRSGPGTGDPNTRYCANLGHKQDDESGLIYMRARYYEPGTGRFVSEDPARDGANWYVYCGNEPIGRADANGKWLHVLLGALAGGLTAFMSGMIADQSGYRLVWTVVLGIALGFILAAEVFYRWAMSRELRAPITGRGTNGG